MLRCRVQPPLSTQLSQRALKSTQVLTCRIARSVVQPRLQRMSSLLPNCGVSQSSRSKRPCQAKCQHEVSCWIAATGILSPQKLVLAAVYWHPTVARPAQSLMVLHIQHRTASEDTSVALWHCRPVQHCMQRRSSKFNDCEGVHHSRFGGLAM